MNKLKTADRVLAVLAGLLIATYFFRLARPALHNYFTADDYQNLWRCWFFPLGSLVKANVLFFQTSPFIRPMVSDWYRMILHFAGMNPYWFRAANLVVLMGNIFLTYAVARRLSGSREIAVIAALLFSYVRPMNFLYFDTGFTCDVLCYFFYFSTFLLYLKVRQQDRLPRPWETVLGCILYICALNAKEMAVTLPGILALYELMWNPPSSWQPRDLVRYAFREGRATLISGVIVIAFSLGRALGPGSLLQDVEYRPIFTWQRLMLTSGSFFNFMTGGNDPWNQWAVLGVWAAMLAIVWLIRVRVLRFAFLFIVLSTIPIDFILPRGPQNYLPSFGWMLFAAILLVQAVAWLTERAWPNQPSLSRVRGAVVFLALISVLYPHYKKLGWRNVNSIVPESYPLRDAAFELRQLEPKLKPKARILLLRNPIFTGGTLYFIVLLDYLDHDLYIYDVKEQGKLPDDATLATFDYIFGYRGGHYVELRGPRIAGHSIDYAAEAAPFRIESLQPSFAGVKMPFNAKPGGQAEVAVFGSDMPGGSTVLWNDRPLQTSGSGTFVVGVVPTDLYEAPGRASVAVRGGNDGFVSNALDFTIYPNTGPEPRIAALYPASTAPGKGFNVQPEGYSAIGVGGKGFLPGVALFIDGTKLTTVFGNGTALSATVPAAFFASPGSHQIWAVNPDGKMSNKAAFKVAN